MGLLDGGLQRVVSGVFRGLLLDGYLHRSEATRALNGKIAQPWADPLAIKGVDAQVTERMIRAPGYTADDVQLIVLRIDATGAVIEPGIRSSDQVTILRKRNGVVISSVRFALSMIDTDPAQGAWIMRATPVEPPA